MGLSRDQGINFQWENSVCRDEGCRNEGTYGADSNNNDSTLDSLNSGYACSQEDWPFHRNVTFTWSLIPVMYRSVPRQMFIFEVPLK